MLPPAPAHRGYILRANEYEVDKYILYSTLGLRTVVRCPKLLIGIYYGVVLRLARTGPNCALYLSLATLLDRDVVDIISAFCTLEQ